MKTTHFTPKQVFKKFILPEIQQDLYNYIWVDMFAGTGNLIVPMLEVIPEEQRAEFFKKHLFMFDIQESLVKEIIRNVIALGVPEEIARENVQVRDSLKDYPKFLLEKNLPVFHITNPPYQRVSYKGYQNLYHIALINDLKHGIKKAIYIIPSNFLFGGASLNKLRQEILPFYKIEKTIIFEKQIFDSTGINVVMCFFERKPIPKHEKTVFEGLKISDAGTTKQIYVLSPSNNYRAGLEFSEFVKQFKADKPLQVEYYLKLKEVEKNTGDKVLRVLDVSTSEYKKIYVNAELFHKVKSNILYVRTIDTGTASGRAGLYEISELGVDGILVSRTAYRSQKIPIFLKPVLSHEDQKLLKDYFNLMLEYFRELTDSEFMTTFRYSKSAYTRKYLGLAQTTALIQTFPILSLEENEKLTFKSLVDEKDAQAVIEFLSQLRRSIYQALP